jgi:flagellar hook-associated protein 2
MADITFSGLASGLATDDIVTKLMKVERAPLDRLTSDKTYEANRLKAYGQLNTRLNDLRTAVDALHLTSDVRTTKVTLSSESAFTATSDSAAPGSYNITVTQLAQVQKSITGGFSSSTTGLLGTGNITVNGKQITVDASNNSLQGLTSSINAASETTGVTATIINDGSGGSTAYRLVLTGKDASTAFTMTSALKDAGGADIAFAATNSQTAQQARLTVDGLAVVSNSNTVADVISGVTLNLNAISPISSSGPPVVYTATKMEVVADSTSLKEKISTFVSSYNKVMEWIVSGYTDDATSSTATDSTDSTTSSTTSDTTDKTEENLARYLRGDVTVNTVKRGLQSILTDTVGNSGSLHILSNIGIATNKDGTLNLNSSKLDKAISTSGQEGLVKLLAGENTSDGVMKKFNSYLLNVTSATKGMYAEKRNHYTSKVNQLDNQITRKTALFDKMEASMKARFTAMETLVSNLNSQSSYLTQQISQWNKSTT